MIEEILEELRIASKMHPNSTINNLIYLAADLKYPKRSFKLSNQDILNSLRYMNKVRKH